MNYFSVCLLKFKKRMATTALLLTVGEQIDRNRDGRSQKSIVAKMNAAGCEITEVQFSNKKNGHEKFTIAELTSLGEILNTDLMAYAE